YSQVKSFSLKNLNHKARLMLLFSLFSIFQLKAQENTLVEVEGKVTNQETHQALGGASVGIKGAITGTVTNDSGRFVLRTKLKFPFTLTFSSVGYQTQEFEVKNLSSKLNIELVTQIQLGTEVVVTASRISESRLKSPVAIEK